MSEVDEYVDNDFNLDSKTAGRWTAEEHKLFLQGLELYQRQWRLISELVKTRTVVQIRTHAQKYFQKLQKSNGNLTKSFSLNDIDNDDLFPPPKALNRAFSFGSTDSIDSNGTVNNLITNNSSSTDNESIEIDKETSFPPKSKVNVDHSKNSQAVVAKKRSIDHVKVMKAAQTQSSGQVVKSPKKQLNNNGPANNSSSNGNVIPQQPQETYNNPMKYIGNQFFKPRTIAYSFDSTFSDLASENEHQFQDTFPYLPFPHQVNNNSSATVATSALHDHIINTTNTTTHYCCPSTSSYEEEGVQLDLSIINLLEKIDWNDDNTNNIFDEPHDALYLEDHKPITSASTRQLATLTTIRNSSSSPVTTADSSSSSSSSLNHISNHNHTTIDNNNFEESSNSSSYSNNILFASKDNNYESTSISVVNSNSNQFKDFKNSVSNSNSISSAMNSVVSTNAPYEGGYHQLHEEEDAFAKCMNELITRNISHGQPCCYVTSNSNHKHNISKSNIMELKDFPCSMNPNRLADSNNDDNDEVIDVDFDSLQSNTHFMHHVSSSVNNNNVEDSYNCSVILHDSFINSNLMIDHAIFDNDSNILYDETNNYQSNNIFSNDIIKSSSIISEPTIMYPRRRGRPRKILHCPRKTSLQIPSYNSEYDLDTTTTQHNTIVSPSMLQRSISASSTISGTESQMIHRSININDKIMTYNDNVITNDNAIMNQYQCNEISIPQEEENNIPVSASTTTDLNHNIINNELSFNDCEKINLKEDKDNNNNNNNNKEKLINGIENSHDHEIFLSLETNNFINLNETNSLLLSLLAKQSVTSITTNTTNQQQQQQQQQHLSTLLNIENKEYFDTFDYEMLEEFI